MCAGTAGNYVKTTENLKIGNTSDYNAQVSSQAQSSNAMISHEKVKAIALKVNKTYCSAQNIIRPGAICCIKS